MIFKKNGFSDLESGEVCSEVTSDFDNGVSKYNK